MKKSCKHEQCTSAFKKKPKRPQNKHPLLLAICYLERSIPGRFGNQSTETFPNQSGLFPLSILFYESSICISKNMTDVRDKQAVHTARRARRKALGGEEFLPGHVETPYKNMFILYLSLRKETASLCVENHLHCKFSTRRSKGTLSLRKTVIATLAFLNLQNGA